VQAIHPLVQINPNECIYCLKCHANFFDHDICLHLKKRAQRRQPMPPPKASVESGGRP
jgi:NosR/NirI family nitrous oxide reductase transcriptional regulator/NosR/NirI family nitrite reductase transcriptional regulator